jgi:hypothetical protein
MTSFHLLPCFAVGPEAQEEDEEDAATEEESTSASSLRSSVAVGVWIS